MTRRVVIFQHMADDSANRFAGLFARDGFIAQTVHLYDGEPIPDLDAYDLMLVLGGAMHVWQEDEFPWLTTEKEVIEDWVVHRVRPYIGICLGHQLLADALGGRVAQSGTSEIGLHHVEVRQGHGFMNGLSGQYPVLHWHHCEVTQMPEGAEMLATADAVSCQAMAVGDHALGVQFHFEWTLDAIRNWPDSWKSDFDKVQGERAYDRFLFEAAAHMPSITAMTERLYRNFSAISGLKAGTDA